MKKILFLFILAAVLSVSGCNQARLRDIDKKIEDLEQEDKLILEEMTSAIEDLEKTLLGKIQASKDKMDGDIDAAIQKLYERLKAKMQENQTYLETELKARKEECDKVEADLRKRAETVINTLDKAFDDVQKDLEAAIAKGDKDLQNYLEELSSTINDTYSLIEDTNKRIDIWEKQVEELEKTGMFEEMKKLETTVEMLQSVDLQEDINAIEERTKEFTNLKMDEMTKEDMAELKSMLSQMDSWMDDADSYTSDSQSKNDEMVSLLDDWRSQADDIYGSIEDYKDAIIDGYAEINALYDDYDGQVSSIVDDIAQGKDLILSYEALISPWEDEIESKVDDLRSWNDEVGNALTEATEQAIILEEVSMEIQDACREWADRHWWYYE